MNKNSVVDLIEELRFIEEKIPPNDSVTRRIAIRSVFSSVETLISALMESTVSQLPFPNVNASHDEQHKFFLEVCALSNVSYQIDDKGNLRISEMPKMPFKNKLLFALNMRAKASHIKLIPQNVYGWNQFSEALKIRNRITHPRAQSDLTVSEAEYNIVIKGLHWLIRCNHRACGGQEY